MLDDGDMLAAIASARDLRLRRRSIRCKVAIALIAVAIAASLCAACMMWVPKSDAVASEPDDSLSIEEALWEAADDGFPDIDWNYWLGINADIVGWITVEGTGIDHPIVQARDESPTFYLSHAIDRSADPKGCVFLDAECEAGLNSMHGVVYGHNWSEGQVLADLAKYVDPAFAYEHRVMLLQTPEWKRRFDVQCVEVANGTDDSNVIAFEGAEQLATWYRERYLASDLQLGLPPADGEDLGDIITFCTCADGEGDKRVLVYAMPETNERAASREAASTA